MGGPVMQKEGDRFIDILYFLLFIRLLGGTRGEKLMKTKKNRKQRGSSSSFFFLFKEHIDPRLLFSFCAHDIENPEIFR